MAESCVFGKQSLGPFRCGRQQHPGACPGHRRRHPFSLGYGVVLPSSLTMVLPIASVCSTCPPVSVLVRAPTALPRGFSWKHGLTGFTHSLRRHVSGSRAARICLGRALRAFTGTSRTPPSYPSPSPHRSIAVRRRCRNVCLLCIGYACRPRLSSRLTLGGLASPRKPWAYGGGVSRSSRATHASILASARSTDGRPPASPQRGTLPYRRWRPPARRFGAMLEPRELSAHVHLTSELLRTL